jgi:phenylacetate-coenzyme A ligase PaaK-like adenylate-forming protein
LLDTGEKRRVFRHACTWFPAFVPADAGGFDDLPFADHELTAKWYAKAVHASRSFSSTGTSGHPKSVPWTPAEDAWYVGEKQDLFALWLSDCARAFISLAVGHNAGSAARVMEGLGLDVHDAGLSTLAAQCEAIVTFAPQVLYCSPSILARLIGGLRERGHRSPSVRRVITNGEVLLPSMRAQVQDFFALGDADVMDTYGSTEIGTIAYTCATCGAYHMLDGLYPETAPAGVAASAGPRGTGRGARADGPRRELGETHELSGRPFRHLRHRRGASLGNVRRRGAVHL